MQLATLNLPQEIHRLNLEARRIRSARTDRVCVAGGDSSREEALLSNLIHRQELENALKQAKLWTSSTERALGILDSGEKLVLHRLLICPERGSIERLCEELELEPSSIYRKRDEALKRFTLAYFGTVEQ